MRKSDSKTNGAGEQTRVEQAEARADQAEARTKEARTRTEQAETRTEQAQSRTEQAETRTEQAETRSELARTRTEEAEVRTEKAEKRSEQAEAALHRMVHKDDDLGQGISMVLLKPKPDAEVPGQNSALELLTARQREILQMIAGGENTKSIAELLKVSPKTIQYHRVKLMACLNLHDVSSLVRYALRTGLIAAET